MADIRNGHRIYHWKHGWIPLDHTAALSKAKGNHKAAARLLSESHSAGHAHASFAGGKGTGGGSHLPVGTGFKPVAQEHLQRSQHVVVAHKAGAKAHLIDNAETMFGTGSAKHMEAMKRFGGKGTFSVLDTSNGHTATLSESTALKLHDGQLKITGVDQNAKVLHVTHTGTGLKRTVKFDGSDIEAPAHPKPEPTPEPRTPGPRRPGPRLPEPRTPEPPKAPEPPKPRPDLGHGIPANAGERGDFKVGDRAIIDYGPFSRQGGGSWHARQGIIQSKGRKYSVIRFDDGSLGRTEHARLRRIDHLPGDAPAPAPKPRTTAANSPLPKGWQVISSHEGAAAFNDARTHQFGSTVHPDDVKYAIRSPEGHTVIVTSTASKPNAHRAAAALHEVIQRAGKNAPDGPVTMRIGNRNRRPVRALAFVEGGDTHRLTLATSGLNYDTSKGNTDGWWMDAHKHNDVLVHTIAHEFGHLHHNANGAPDYRLQGEVIKDMSKYGRKDSKEGYAEAFAQHVTGDTTDRQAHRDIAAKFAAHYGWAPGAKTSDQRESWMRMGDGTKYRETDAGFTLTDGSRTVHVFAPSSMAGRAQARKFIASNDIRNLHGVGRKASGDEWTSTIKLDADGRYTGPKAALLRQG